MVLTAAELSPTLAAYCYADNDDDASPPYSPFAASTSSSLYATTSPPICIPIPVHASRDTETPAESCDSNTHRRRRRKMPRAARPKRRNSRMAALVTVALLATQASGVMISKFSNCLSRAEQRDPNRIQFHPIMVAAQLDKVEVSDMNDLKITVWGTVTGAESKNPSGAVSGDTTTRRRLKRQPDSFGGRSGGYETLQFLDDLKDTGKVSLWKRQDNTTPLTANASLPALSEAPPLDNRWPSSSVNYTYTGAIIGSDAEWNDNQLITAVNTRIVISSFEVKSTKKVRVDNDQNPNTDAFCAVEASTIKSAVNANCPFGDLLDVTNTASEDPTGKTMRIPAKEYQNNVTYLEAHLPSFTVQRTLPSDFQFASLGVTMKIQEGPENTVIGCIHVELTPALDSASSNAITWFTVCTLILVAIGTIVAAMFNPWNGTTDVFKWSSNYGMDHDMLRLITPGFADCLHWLQFVVLTGGLTLEYPGFYTAVVSKVAWSSLLLDISFYSDGGKTNKEWVRDGLLVTESWRYGFEKLGQAVGLLTVNDIWVSIAIWYCIIMVGCVVLFQLWFWIRHLVRKAIGREEGDFSSRNWPFTVGLINRITFNWFLVPLLAGSLFQLTVAKRSSVTLVALAAVTAALMICAIVWYTWLIHTHRPRQALWDQLPTLLVFGTFYNTYQETTLKFFPVQLYANVLRAIVIGAVQPSGVAQISVLMGIEMLLMLSILGVQPFHRETSMNLIYFIFSAIRLVTVMLQLAFVPSLNASDAVKGWAGWIILGIHGLTVIIFFLLKALQTLLEMVLRGYRSEEEASRGGLVKVFGKRQLHRRKHRAGKQTHRSSSLTPTPMSASERKPTNTTSISSPAPYSRSNSSAILLKSPTTIGDRHTSLILGTEGSQSGHGHSASASTTAGFTPTSPGASGYGYIPTTDLESPTYAPAAGPYYRTPRTRRQTLEGDLPSPGAVSRHSWGSNVLKSAGIRHASVGSLPQSALGNQVDVANDDWNDSYIAAGAASTIGSHPHGQSAVTVGSSNNKGATDYAVRESDFYYGVRGPALNTQPVRRLGTGPADPTGPVSNAKSWIKQKLGIAKGKEERGFSVVRSSRAPEQMLAAQREMELEQSGAGPSSADGLTAGGDEKERNPTPSPSQIGVAITSGHDTHDPDSSDDDEAGPSTGLLSDTEADTPKGVLDGTTDEDQHASTHLQVPTRRPTVPRKSSKRKSRSPGQRSTHSPDQRPGSELYDPPIDRSESASTNRLPFTGAGLGRDRESSFGSTVSSVLSPPEGIQDDEDEKGRPASVGTVRTGMVGSVMMEMDERAQMRGSQAELVRGGSHGSGVGEMGK